MAYLVLLRHGQSIWNKLNLFTGWVDVPLSLEGINEALNAAEKIKSFCFDEVYTSLLIRSIQTAMISLSKIECGKMPVIQHEEGLMKTWSNMDKNANILPVYENVALNERYYGSLQGKNKEEMSVIYGENVVHTWRRSYDTKPPGGESLQDNYKRTIPFFENVIFEKLKDNKNILISAHGNSLRSIMKFIENISDEEIPHIEVPTGTPIVYNFEGNNLLSKKVLDG